MKNLRTLRQQKNLSQQALAEKLDTIQQTIYKYENQITEPNIDMLKSMADFFDVSVDYLIGYSSRPHKVENTKKTYLNADELSLIQKYRSLPPSSRKAFQQLMFEFLQNSLP